MNDPGIESFEAELQRLKPAKPPVEFLARLAAAQPMARKQPDVRSRPARQPESWRVLLRWLAPAAATVTVAVILVRLSTEPEHRPASRPVMASTAPLKADDVEIDRQLLTSFDAVAQMPGGEPVRFRCREWMDNIVLRDSARGVEVEQRKPRLEIVPVRLETY